MTSVLTKTQPADQEKSPHSVEISGRSVASSGTGDPAPRAANADAISEASEAPSNPGKRSKDAARSWWNRWRKRHDKTSLTIEVSDFEDIEDFRAAILAKPAYRELRERPYFRAMMTDRPSENGPFDPANPSEEDLHIILGELIECFLFEPS